MNKLALDYDDTIDQCYPFFADLTAALKKAGWEIHIVTHIYEDYRQFRERQLEENNITYDVLAITGEKFKYCKENGIEYIFDDVRDYFRESKNPPAYLVLHTIPITTNKIIKKKSKKTKSNIKKSHTMWIDFSDASIDLIRSIENEEDLKSRTSILEILMDKVEKNGGKDHPLYNLCLQVADIIEKYENEHYPV